MQFRFKWAVINNKCCVCYIAVFWDLVLVDELNCVGGQDTFVITLCQTTPFIAEAFHPYVPIATLENQIYCFFFPVWSVDVVYHQGK